MLDLKGGPGDLPEGDRPSFAAGQVVYNFLVPAPELPPEEERYLPPPTAAPLLTTASPSALPPLPKDIPMVKIR